MTDTIRISSLSASVAGDIYRLERGAQAGVDEPPERYWTVSRIREGAPLQFVIQAFESATPDEIVAVAVQRGKDIDESERARIGRLHETAYRILEAHLSQDWRDVSGSDLIDTYCQMGFEALVRGVGRHRVNMNPDDFMPAVLRNVDSKRERRLGGC